MDLVKVLHDLYAQREVLKRSIASLEDLAQNKVTPAPGVKRRGRPVGSMGPGERLEVSKRLTLYWDARRTAKTKENKTSL